MASIWNYSDFETRATRAEQVSTLRLHIAEVAAAIEETQRVHGRDYNGEHFVTYLETVLYPRLRELSPVNTADDLRDSPRARAAFTRGRPV